jgi:hypothetical protein
VTIQRPEYAACSARIVPSGRVVLSSYPVTFLGWYSVVQRRESHPEAFCSATWSHRCRAGYASGPVSPIIASYANTGPVGRDPCGVDFDDAVGECRWPCAKIEACSMYASQSKAYVGSV